MPRLFSHTEAGSHVAWRAGRPVRAAAFLADATRLAGLLPERGPVLNLCADRYRFATGFAAALLRRHTCLLPPTHTREMLAQLHHQYPDLYLLIEQRRHDTAVPQIVHPADVPHACAPERPFVVPEIESGFTAAIVFTSGSTGRPSAHTKSWGKLVVNARAEGERLIGERLAGFCLVGTVPPQHMYGFESTVLLALHNEGAFDASHAFYPADIAAALRQVDAPRILVSTPFHLRKLLDAGVSCPPLALVVSATAPLAPQLAQRAEAKLAAPLIEIYGCTEAGQLASRRTTEGAGWRTLPGVRLHAQDGCLFASGGHVEGVVPLSDELSLRSECEFTLLGRSADMVNIAGRRTSLAHLNHQLNSIPGVRDGAFWLPPPQPDEGLAAQVLRPVAFAVAPSLCAAELLAALRDRIDPAFLPRPLHLVARLPRNSTGKLPAQTLAALAERLAARTGKRRERR